MPDLPTGTVTFLFTDVESSTRLWARAPDAMREALERHDRIVRNCIESLGGYIFSTAGDGFAAAFARADRALAAAVRVQEALVREPWPAETPIRVRLGVHTGEAEERDGNYFGTALNRAARLMAIAHGGQTICSSVTASLVEGQIDLLDLGEHRLRDLDLPMHVFQVDGGSFPPLRSLDAYPGNLPVQLTSFVGRERELKVLFEAMASQRLVTLAGTGGVGKTRLALQAAAEVAPSYPDGVWLAELAAASDPESMFGVVATSLGTQPREGSPVEGITDFVGDRRLLLILDNCEHLLAAAATLAERLLLVCRQAHVLATSREALDVAGERVVRLRSLEVPAVNASPEEITSIAAGRLFVERAESAGAGLTLDETELQAVGELCRRLDGIPLAIELAAARSIAMSPTEVAARLDERFRLLTGGRRAAVERHQTLRATIDWSYSILDETDQRVFASLGVFPASFTAEAAQKIAGGDGIEEWDVMDALTSLVGKSMLTADHVGGATRYQMLESLRHYARERLDARGISDALRRCHAHYVGDFVDRFMAGVQTGDEAKWNAAFRAEFDNVRTAILWSLDSTDEADGDLALRIIAIAVAAQSGGLSGILPLAALAADRARRGDLRYRSSVLMGASLDAFTRGDLARSNELLREGNAAGVPPGAPFAGIGPLVWRLAFEPSSELPRLIAEGRQTLVANGATDWELTQYLASSASMATLRGHLEMARADSAQALELARGMRSPTNLAVASYSYALSWWQAQPDEALSVLEAGLDALHLTVNAPIEDRALALAAQLQATIGELDAARASLGSATAQAHANGDRQGMATVLARGAFVLHFAGDDQAAAVMAGVVTDGLLARLRALPQHEQPAFDQLLVEIAEALGSDRYKSCIQRGATLSYGEIVAFLSELTRREESSARRF